MPYGVLLSGGLDSSLVASIMSRNSQRFPRFELDGSGEWFQKWTEKLFGSEVVEILKMSIFKSCWVLIHQCCKD